MEELLALLGIGGGGLLVGDAYGQLGDIGETAWSESQRIGGEAADASSFKGYGVTGPSGGTTVAPGGSTQFNLSPGGQQFTDVMTNNALGLANPNNAFNQYAKDATQGAQGMLSGVTGGAQDREQEIYDRIRAMQMPGEQRADLALGSRLAAQGRTGLETAAYGGSPEQLALAKAREEAKNAASYNAIGLAGDQQAREANIMDLLSGSAGRSAGTAGTLAQQYGLLSQLPQSALLDMFGAGSNAFGYEDVARRTGAGHQAEAQMGGLEGLLGAGLGQANLTGQIGSGLLGGGMNMLGNVFEQGDGFLQGLWDKYGFGGTS